MGSAESKHSAQAIKTAASYVECEPEAYMNAAKAIVEQYCKLPFDAFGIVGMPAMSQYDSAHSSQLQNLKDGSTILGQMVAGMLQVAGNFDAAEKASSIAPAYKVSIDTSRPTGDVPLRNSIDRYAGIGIESVNIGLSAVFWTAAAMMGASAGLAPAAFFAGIAWLTCIPNDQAIANAKAGWEKAATYISDVKVDKALSSLGDAEWSSASPSRNAFNQWVERFNNQVSSAGSDASGMATTLQTIVDSLHDLMHLALAFSAGTLTLLIALTLAEVGVVDVPAIEAIKNTVGLALSVTIGTGVVGAIGYLIWQAIGAIGNLSSTSDGFKSHEIKSGGEVTFTDIQVNLSKDWPSLAVNPPYK